MSSSHGSEPPRLGIDDLGQDCFDVVAIPPPWVVRLKPPDIRNPPDVIPCPSLAGVRPVHRPAGQPLAYRDGFQHRAIGVATTPNIINRAGPRILNKVPEGIDKVPGMDVVANLLALVAKHLVWQPGDGAFCEIGKEPVQHRAGVAGPRQTTASKARSFQPKVTTVFLDQDIGGEL